MATANPFRFSTKYQDDETGLLYYGYRFYDPSTGRWNSYDPLAEAGSINLNLFVNNDPNSFFDGHGLRSVRSIQCIVGTKQDGLLGPKTTALIREFQNLLILAGCLDKGGSDGAWGPKTEAAYARCKAKDSLQVPGTISFYCPCTICCGPSATGRCADTSKFVDGVLAAPYAIPMGSTITFKLDGETQTQTVHDRGREDTIRMKNEVCRIDYGISNHEKCLQKGKVDVSLSIKMNHRDCDNK